MRTISTDQIDLALDDHANLALLKNRLTGHDYAGKAPFWRLYYQQGQHLHREITPEGQTPAITVRRRALTVTYKQLNSRDGPLPIRLTFRITVEGDESRWSATVVNNTGEFLVKELQFPEVRVSDRDIRDDTDIERRVNWAFQRGLLHDVEIYRCRRTIAATPHYQSYLGRVNALRERFADFLHDGRYTDTEGFAIDSEQVDARAFVAGDRMAVVVCQSHLPEASATLRVPGYRFAESSHLGSASLLPGPDYVAIRLGKHGLAILVFQRSPQKKPSTKGVHHGRGEMADSCASRRTARVR